MEIAQSELVYDDPMESAEGGLLASESLWPSAYPLWGEAPIESWRYQYVKRGIDLFFRFDHDCGVCYSRASYCCSYRTDVEGASFLP